MKKHTATLFYTAMLAGIVSTILLSAQPQPGAARFTTVTTTSTAAGSVVAGGGITAGTGAVGIVNTSGKIPALSSTYVADLSGANLTFPWTGITFSSGNFTASGSMTWTVDSGDQGTNAYTVVGSTVHWTFGFFNTTVGGTASSELRVTLPGGFTAAGSSTNGTCATADNAVLRYGMWQVVAGNTYASLYRDITGANWDVGGTNATSIRCMITFAK